MYLSLAKVLRWPAPAHCLTHAHLHSTGRNSYVDLSLLGIFRPYNAKICDVWILVHLPKLTQFFSNSQKLTSMMFFFLSKFRLVTFLFKFSSSLSYFDWSKCKSPFENSNHYVKFFRVKFSPAAVFEMLAEKSIWEQPALFWYVTYIYPPVMASGSSLCLLLL